LSATESKQEGGLSGPLKTVDDFVRAVAQGATFGYADEIAARLSQLTGVGAQKAGAKTYEDLVKAERERQAAIPTAVALPGEIAGGLLTAGGLARQGLTLLKPVGSTSAGTNIGRGAVEGAAYGALAGSGEGTDAESRIIGALGGGILGAPFGAAGGAIASKLTKAPAPASVGELRDTANTLYQSAREAGVVFKPSSAQKIVEDLSAVAKDFGADEVLQPKAMRALSILTERAPSSLDDIENARKILSNVAFESTERAERRLASRMLDKMDEIVGGFKRQDIVTGSPDAVAKLNEARGLWSRLSKGEKIENAIARARVRASQFSGSGEENALRTEFRQIAMNERRMRGFNKEEQDAIRKVAEGGSTENILRYLGKLAPTGVVSGGVGAGAGYTLGGPVGAVAVPAIGAAARSAATGLTQSNAEFASRLARAGGSATLQPRAMSPLEMMVYRAGVTQPGQQAIRGLLGQ
jgi:hypothetical protein